LINGLTKSKNICRFLIKLAVILPELIKPVLDCHFVNRKPFIPPDTITLPLPFGLKLFDEWQGSPQGGLVFG